ncbi:MAG: FUSC family protein [Methylovirgula sp.]|nr:FUSC family protein [Methylovirgula sp.]
MLTAPLFTARDWIFSLRTFGAAVLALGLAMWIDLPRPYWALTTVYITSQIFAGATRSKAIFRVMGTTLGAVAAMVFVPNFVDSPELLTLVMALWAAGCLYVSLLDRTPASYLPMLAGYSAALIGFPTVDAPATIFDTAVARTEEITLGIVCATLASSLVFPQSVKPVIEGRLNAWVQEARAWIIGALSGDLTESQAHAGRLHLAAEAVALDALAIPLQHESAPEAGQGRVIAVLRQHMLMYLPIVSTIADRITILERAKGLPERMALIIGDLKAWIASGRNDAVEIGALRRAIDTADPAFGPAPSAGELACATLADRLRDFIDLRLDFQQLRQALADGAPAAQRLVFRYTAQMREIRHRDHTMALLSAAGLFTTVAVTCAIWIATSWTDGSSAVMMAAVAFSLFASQDDPTPQIMKFANAGLIGVTGAAIYLFALLPRATNFEMLTLALAPGLIMCGLAMTKPRWALLGHGAIIFGATTISIQNGYSADFALFANGALAVIAGIWIAALVTRLMRTVEAAVTAQRLRRVNRRELVRAALENRAQDSLELAALMLDRVGLIATRLTSIPPEETEWTTELLAEVRVGINLVELRRAERGLPRAVSAALRSVLLAVAQHFSTDESEPPAALLAAIDDTLDLAAANHTATNLRATQIGLYGLRRGLFPNAAPYRPTANLQISEVAA